MKKNSISNSEEFFIAADKGDIKKVTAFLEADIDPNLQDQAGWTALHEAVHGNLFRDNSEVIKFLREKKANTKVKNRV